MPQFSALNAREMAAKSHAARKAAEEERNARAARVPLEATAESDTGGVSLARVRVRLETLDALMAKAKTDREWDNLSRSYERLFKVWCVLTNTPGPGNRRPGPERKPQRRVFEAKLLHSPEAPLEKPDG